MRFAASVVPDELPAAIVSARVLVVPDPVALLWRRKQTGVSVHAEGHRWTAGRRDDYVVEELAVLGGPSDLHHPRRNDGHLVVPNPRVHAERAAHALEGGGVASCLGRGGGGQKKVSASGTGRHIPKTGGRARPHLQPGGGDLKVLADVVAVEHGVDVGEVDFFVRELPTLL